MDDAVGLKQQLLVMRDQTTRLSAATLRINESLDFETALQGVLDSARE